MGGVGRREERTKVIGERRENRSYTGKMREKRREWNIKYGK